MNTVNKCENCVGIGNCNKYCVLKAGRNLVNFVNRINLVETKIGDIQAPGRLATDRNSYIISGQIMQSGSSPTHILTGLDTSIDITGKFNKFNDINANLVLKAYVDTLDISDEVKASTIETFKRVNSNKLLPLAFKPGNECEIKIEHEEKELEYKAKMHHIQWKADTKTGKIECTILFDSDRGFHELGVSYLRLPVTDYGTKFRLTSIEIGLSKSDVNRQLISMTPIGLVKPIIVKDNKVELALDGDNLYRVLDDYTVIVGKWKNGELESFQGGIDGIKKTKAYKYIQYNLQYIEKHRHLIVPYGFQDAYKVEL